MDRSPNTAGGRRASIDRERSASGGQKQDHNQDQQQDHNQDQQQDHNQDQQQDHNLVQDPRIVADLHVHTTASDGSLPIEDVPVAARRADLEWVAVTDHDCLHPALDAPVVTRGGIRIIRGIELRVEDGSHRFDLLGYAVEPTSALETELDRLQADRRNRGRRIIDCVESRLNVELDIEPRDGLGRPHIAHAIADSEAPYGYQDAFDQLIGADCPCYVSRDVTPIDRGIDLLSESCAFVSLAHPFRYDDLDAAFQVARDLDAIERWYSYGFDVDTNRLDRFAETAGLLRTGGSDAHDRHLGVAGLSEAAFEPVHNALSSSLSSPSATLETD